LRLDLGGLGSSLQGERMGGCSARVLGVLAACLCCALPRVDAAEWITFDSSPAQRDSPRAGDTANPVRAYLALPVEPGPHPGVILLSACDGQRPYQQAWARALAARGLAALLIDHYFMHDRGSTCDGSSQVVNLQMRLRHARAAMRFLASIPQVDGSRLAILGWGDAPLRAMLGAESRGGSTPPPVAAVVAITPQACPQAPLPDTSWLALLAAAEPASSSHACLEPHPGVETVTYPGTHAGFDDPRAGEGGAGTRRHYDRLAHATAIDDVVSFLGRHLAAGASGEHQYAIAAPAAQERGVWAVDPNDPGPDLPPRGASLFDRIFSRSNGNGADYDVPFPFPRLLAKLEEAAGRRQLPRSALDFALIPLGRSLQREAAAPDYFDSPRIVVAVTERPAAGPLPRVPLDNRLFLGYQPRAGVLEVISYNEEAARFEFQIVRGYRAGATPEVRYARRALCTSCHQNAAPIFAEASWAETNANPRIVTRLRALGETFHGVAIGEDNRGVAAIDSATDEANLLPVFQRLWREGCAGATPPKTLACRAGALLAMLQYRLSAGAGFDRGAALYRAGYLRAQGRNWRERWPDGLLVPSSRLPDRTPLMLPVPSSVPVAQDPLRRRPPAERWSAGSRRDLERMIRGLSRTLPEQHVALLDTFLREAGSIPHARALRAPCTILRRGMGTGTLQVECTASGDTQPSFGASATMSERPDGTVEGSARWLEFADGTYVRLRVRGETEHGAGERRIVVRLAHRFLAAAVRSPRGDAIDAFAVSWDPAHEARGRRWPATGELRLAGDFRPVTEALARAAADGAAASPLGADRFDARRLSRWLLATLGATPAVSGHVEGRDPTPEPIAEAVSASARGALSAALEHLGPLQTFNRFCGACHGADSRYPPGFLYGDTGTNRSAVAHCAERIYYRLSMWHRAPERRGVPPMPPVQGLLLAGTEPEAWRGGASLARLIAYVKSALEEQGVQPERLLERAYGDTRACLARPSRTSAQ
jgi:dienelactone hydrolase/mono/diheme cytochrome c family protein